MQRIHSTTPRFVSKPDSAAAFEEMTPDERQQMIRAYVANVRQREQDQAAKQATVTTAAPQKKIELRAILKKTEAVVADVERSLNLKATVSSPTPVAPAPVVQQPKPDLLAMLRQCHAPEEVYDVWLVRDSLAKYDIQLIIGQVPSQVREALLQDGRRALLADVENSWVFIDSDDAFEFARAARVHPRAAKTAIILHESGHCLAARDGKQGEGIAWEIGYSLLDRHSLWSFCSDVAFRRCRETALKSYAV